MEEMARKHKMEETRKKEETWHRTVDSSRSKNNETPLSRWLIVAVAIQF